MYGLNSERSGDKLNWTKNHQIYQLKVQTLSRVQFEPTLFLERVNGHEDTISYLKNHSKDHKEEVSKEHNPGSVEARASMPI